MVKKGAITRYRERLDKTLASPDLTDEETLTYLVKNQILLSRDNKENRGCVNDTLSKRVAELSNLLDMLRSASDNYVDSSLNKVSHPSWKVKSDNEEFRVMYREGPLGSPIHTLLAEGYVDASIDSCLCVSWETSIYRTWFPESKIPTFKVTTAKCLQKICIDEQISLVRMKLSWPLNDREAVLHYFEFEYFQDDLIVVVLNSVPDVEDIIPQTHGFTDDETAEAGQTVRLDFVGGFALQKVTEDRSYFRTIGNLDVKLDFVPPAFINFVSRQLIGSGFKLYKKSVASISDGNKNFNMVLKDPLYQRIREVIYSRGKPNSNPRSEIVEGDPDSDPDEHYHSSKEEFQDEDIPVLCSKDIEESSSKYEQAKDFKSSCVIKEDEALDYNNNEANGISTNKQYSVDTVGNSDFKHGKLRLSAPVVEALGTLKKAISMIHAVRLDNQVLDESFSANEGDGPKQSLNEENGIGSGSGADKRSSDKHGGNFDLLLRPTESSTCTKKDNPNHLVQGSPGQDLAKTIAIPPLASHHITNDLKEAPVSGKTLDGDIQLVMNGKGIHDQITKSTVKKKLLQKKQAFCCLSTFSAKHT